MIKKTNKSYIIKKKLKKKIVSVQNCLLVQKCPSCNFIFMQLYLHGQFFTFLQFRQLPVGETSRQMFRRDADHKGKDKRSAIF